jgi:cytochrome c-type biogenesis protein CcmH
VLLCVVALLFIPAVWATSRAAAAQTASRAAALSDSALDARTREVASQLRCPVCQGESIEASPSTLAQEMRTLVRQQLAAGRTPDEVKAYFVSKYGEWILLEPRAAGVTAAVYVLPLVMLAVGAAVIVVSVRRWTKGGAPAVEPSPPEPAAEDRQATVAS